MPDTISCEPDDLAAAAKCFCIPDRKTQEAIMIYLLYTLSGLNMTVKELVAASKCYCIGNDKTRDSILIYLACKAAQAAGA